MQPHTLVSSMADKLLIQYYIEQAHQQAKLTSAFSIQQLQTGGCKCNPNPNLPQYSMKCSLVMFAHSITYPVAYHLQHNLHLQNGNNNAQVSMLAIKHFIALKTCYLKLQHSMTHFLTPRRDWMHLLYTYYIYAYACLHMHHQNSNS
jgi:hypothetical protein